MSLQSLLKDNEFAKQNESIQTCLDAVTSLLRGQRRTSLPLSGTAELAVRNKGTPASLQNQKQQFSTVNSY